MDGDRLVTSAPGKMILFGEHAVVYGEPALAVTLSQRTWVSLALAPATGDVELQLSDLGVSESWRVHAITDVLAALEPMPARDGDDDDASKPVFVPSRLDALRAAGLLRPDAHLSVSGFLYFLVSFLLDVCSTPAERHSLVAAGLACHMASQLPIGAGLGSSAAFSVAMVHAFFAAMDRRRSPGPERPFERPGPEQLRTINDWAFVVETLIHGTPSGIDNTCSTYGGAVQYARGKDWHILQAVPRLRFLVTNTKVPRSTKQLVAGLRERWQADPDTYNPMLAAVGRITAACQQLFATADSSPAELEHRLADMIAENQEHLRQFGVSHESIENVVRLSLAHGFAAKLTGAGGGGCVITLLPDAAKPEDVRNFIDQVAHQGLGDCFETGIGGPGATFHPDLIDLQHLHS